MQLASRIQVLLPTWIQLRAAAATDDELLYSIYASTRVEELALVPWSEAEIVAFLRMQHRAQDSHYRLHYVAAEFLVIECSGVGAGRLYLHRREQELRIVDLALLPAYRRRGIGTSLLQAIIAVAEQHDPLRLSIHVEQNNPAQHLYRRLGFEPIGENGIYHLLERKPSLKPEHK